MSLKGSRAFFIKRNNGTAPTKEKGGSPVDARQEVFPMEAAIAEVQDLVKVPRIIQSTDSAERTAGKWLDTQVENAAKFGVTSIIVDVGPTLAAVLLNRNEDNRRLSEHVVKAYARDMENDGWRFNGEPIIISADGKLNDGQHRCAAIIKADRDVRMLMVFGVDRSTRTTLDQGKIRTSGDYLAMEGYGNTLQLGTIASFAWQVMNHGRLATNSEKRPTKGEILAFVEDHPNIIQSLNIVSNRGARVIGGISVLGTAHWLISQKAGKNLADNFVIAMIEGANLKVGDPILYTRNRLTNEGRRLRANERLELVIKAWNSHRAKQTVRAYSISGGDLPKISR